MRILRNSILAAVVVSLFTMMASADDDPPSRVARLQYMAGSVSVQPRGTEDWVGASLNRPLTTADNIWTDKDSRAELNIGTASLRVDDETSLTLTNISDNTVQLQLHQGVLNLRVRRLYDGEIYEIDTPNLAFTLQKSGEYRFDVAPDGNVTLVTVWKGEGHATGDGPAVRIRSHQRARFTSGTSLAHEIYEAPQPDGFDDWCRVRNQREDHSVSARYVSPGVIGYEDLDEYGSWRTVPTYGAIWVPTVVSAGWAPYRYGHWVWISPWGWTWVDDASWGFAPFHYGRWIYTGGYWGWAPGPVYVRPVYAPALVAWFGGGFGVSVGYGSGYGWCPLGYGEPYIPWYRGSRGYFRNVNVSNTRITNITYVTNNYYNYGDGDGGRKHVKAFNYANAQAPNGVTAVDRRTIVDSRPVAKAIIPVAEKDVRGLNSSHLQNRMELEPTRESRLGINADKPAVVPPTRAVERPVVSRIAPAGGNARQNRKADENLTNRPTSERIVVNEATPRLPARVVPRPTQPGQEKPAEAVIRSVDDAPRVATPEPVSGARQAEPGIGRMVPRPPQQGQDKRNEIRSGGDTPKAVTPQPVSEARPAEPGIGRMVPRPPAANRGVEEGHEPQTPRVNRDNAPQAGERTSSRGADPVTREVARPAVGVTPQPAAEPRTAPANSVPRPSGPVSQPRESVREDRSSRSAGPSAPAQQSRPVMESPRSNSPGPSYAPAPSRPAMEAPRQSAPAQSAPSAPHSSAAPSSPHSSPASSAPSTPSSPAPHSAPSSGPRGNPNR
jgi:hypothetical protein